MRKLRNSRQQNGERYYFFFPAVIAHLKILRNRREKIFSENFHTPSTVTSSKAAQAPKKTKPADCRLHS